MMRCRRPIQYGARILMRLVRRTILAHLSGAFQCVIGHRSSGEAAARGRLWTHLKSTHPLPSISRMPRADARSRSAGLPPPTIQTLPPHPTGVVSGQERAPSITGMRKACPKRRRTPQASSRPLTSRFARSMGLPHQNAAGTPPDGLPAPRSSTYPQASLARPGPA
jgi:hypothetical protein